MNSWLLGCLVLIFFGVYALGIVEPSAEFLSVRRLQIGINDRKLEFNLQTSNIFAPEFEVTHVDSTGQEIRLPFDTSRFYQGSTSSGHTGIFQIQDKIVHSATILTGDDLISLERKENKLILQKFSELEDHHLLSKASKPCFNGTGVKQEAVIMKRQLKTNATCSIQLVADSDFVSRFADNNAVSNYMATVFGGMNTIFQRNFPGKIAMSLSGIKIYSDPTTDPYLNVGGGQNEYQNLLNKVQSNVISGVEKEACLVHLFTHRNLQGTMGVAFVGGICSPQNRGRNSAMTTTMYIDGSSSSMLRHTASFTHECGHNFGASHDGDQSPARPECSPPNAPYLMYFSTLSAAGSRNQFTFSPCSMENITLSVKSCFNVDLSTMTRTVPVQFAYPTTGSLETSSNNSSSAIKLAGIIAGVVIGGVCIIIIAVVITLKISRSRQIQ